MFIFRRGRFLATLLAMIALGLLAAHARATDVRWNNPAGGTFTTPGNWLGGIAPGAGDIADFGVVLVGTGPTYTVTIPAAVTNQGLVVHRDSVTLSTGPGATYTVSGAGLAADSFIVGQSSGENASLTLLGSFNTSQSSAAFHTVTGKDAGSIGTVTLGIGAAWTNNSEERIGEGGAGALNMSQNAIHTVTGNLLVGALAGSSGTANVNAAGASLTLNGAVYLGGTSAASGGAGSLNISNGSVSTTGTIKIWNTTNTLLNLSGGSLSANRIDASANPLRFNWTAGSLTLATYLDLSDAADPVYNAVLGNSLTINASQTLQVGMWEFLYGNGSTITQNGGSNTTFELYMGNVSGIGTPATYNLAGGTLTLTTANLGHMGTYAGPSSTALFNHTGGTHSVNTLNLGTSANGSATYGLNGESAQLDVGSTVNVGQSGTGVMNIQNGTATVNGLFKVWNTAGTAVNLSGGTLSVATFDTSGSPARFIWTGGTFALTGMGILFDAGGPLGNAIALPGSQSLTVTGGNLIVGQTGIGSISKTGPGSITVGTLAVNRQFNLATNAGSTGTLTLNHAAAQVTVNGTMSLGGASGGSGIVNLTSGAISLSGQLTIWNSASTAFNLNGGTLTALSLDTKDNPARFNWTFGTLILKAGLVVEPVAPLGGTLSFVPGKNLTTQGPVGLGGIAQAVSTGTINQAGGTVTINSSLQLGSGAGGTGIYNFSAGFLTVTNSTFVGDFGSGTFTQLAGVANFADLYIATNPGSTGVVTLNNVAGTFSAPFNNTYVGGNNFGAGGTGSITINNGAMTLGFLTVYASGTVTLNGGTLNIVLLNTFSTPSRFNWTGGTLGIQNLIIEPSGPLGGTLTLTPSKILNANGGIGNNGLVTLAGGAIGGTGLFSNANALIGFGKFIGAVDFANLGQLTVVDGTLTFQNQGPNLNYGTIDLTPGFFLSLTNSNLTNHGIIHLNSSTIIGTGTLINAGGIISGPGAIHALLQNTTGTVLVTAGSTILTSGVDNGGIIHLTDIAAILAGEQIDNHGTIQGRGSISTPLLNFGIIEPQSGTLAITGGITNDVGAVFSIPTGSKLLITSGIAQNFGIISLTGGTFDNNNHPLDNSGQISGYGILRTSTLTNNGIFTLTGSGGPGTTTVNGNVINASGHLIEIKFDPAIFTGAVTNNAGAIIKTTDTTVTFAGAFTNNGQFLSDPSTNIFQSSVTISSTSLMTGGIGDVFIFLGGSVTNHGNFQNGGTLSAHVSIANHGTFTQSGPQTWVTNTTFTNNAGTATFATDAGTSAASPLNVTINAGTVRFTSHQHLRSLTMAHTGPSYPGTLDLTTKKLVLTTAGPADKAAKITELAAAIKANAITSSTAVNPSNYDIGLFDNALLQSAGESPTALILALARLGDTNLDAIVDINDLGNLANNWQQPAATWSRGDFNLDGFVDINDLGILASNWQQTSTFPLLPNTQYLLPNTQPTNIPEPTTLALLALALPLLARRRRA